MADMVRVFPFVRSVNALLPRCIHGEGFSLCEISRLSYHVADMVRVFLYVRSQGSSTTWQLSAISRLFYHVADMVRVFLLCEISRLFYHVATW
jgi:hypothetical protein